MRRHPVPRVMGMLRAMGILACGVLAACGMPRPFAHTDDTVPDLARLETAAGVTVVPPQGLAPTLAEAAAEGLAGALTAAGLPAQAAPEAAALEAGGYIVRGLLRPARPGDEDRQLIWELRAPEGTSLALDRQPIPSALLDGSETIGSVAAPAPTPGPEEGGGGGAGDDDVTAMRALGASVAADFLVAIDRDADAPLSQRMAAPAPRPLPDVGPVAPAQDMPQVAVAQVDGLSEARARLLAAAVAGALQARGIRVGDSASLTVSGHVTLGPEEDGTRSLRVVWTVFHADGREAGTADQANSVPATLWESRFPALAGAIAGGAAEGVAAVLGRTIAH